MKSMLPIGSVVLLKGMNKRVMIQGRLQKDIDTQKVFDYCGCIYPYGVQDTKKTLLFNETDIQAIFFIGFQDIEEITYRKEILNELNKNQD